LTIRGIVPSHFRTSPSANPSAAGRSPPRQSRWPRPATRNLAVPLGNARLLAVRHLNASPEMRASVWIR